MTSNANEDEIATAAAGVATATATATAAAGFERQSSLGVEDIAEGRGGGGGSSAANSSSENDADAEEELQGGDVYPADYKKSPFDDLNLPPGRMHATRVQEVLLKSEQAGSKSGLAAANLQIPPHLNSILLRRGVGSAAGHRRGGSTGSGGGGGGSGTPRSRSRSPSVKEKATATTVAADGNSSISSLEEFVDQDILYDRAGLVELDSESVQRRMHNSREFINLPPVNERLSEETLDDVHAFSDLNASHSVTNRSSSNASRGANSMGTGRAGDDQLEPLNEEDDEDDDLDDVSESGGIDGDPLLRRPRQGQPQVILTNLENLTLQQDRFALQADENPGTRMTGESSLLEEAPSAPTA